MSTPQRIAPAAGQESVWDYPRPPRLERTLRRLRVIASGVTIADTVAGWRILETSHPPVYYIPPADTVLGYLRPAPGSSFCEFKGVARYWSLVIDQRRIDDVAWSYDAPARAFADIAGHLAFYASRVDACFVDDERVQAQSGDFYGGWITADIVGPFKGAPGTRGW